MIPAPSRRRRVGRVLAALLVGLAWLGVAGLPHHLGPRLSPGWTLLYGGGAAALFLLVHVVAAGRRSATRPPIAAIPLRHLAPTLAAAVAIIAANVLWLLSVTTPDQFQPDSVDAAHFYLVVVLFPLIEEFAFRGWLFLALARLMPPLAAMLVSTALFAALHSHGDWITQVGGGLGYGAALPLTRSIWAPFAMHALDNAIVLALSSSADVNTAAAALSGHHHLLLVYLAWFANLAVIAVAAVAIARARPPRFSACAPSWRHNAHRALP